MKASEIAALIGGRFEGAADPDIRGLAPLDRAGAEELSFLADPKYVSYLQTSQAGAVLIAEALLTRGSTQLPRIVVQDVHRALAAILPRLYPERVPAEGVHATAVLGANVELGSAVSIGAHVVIGDGTRIGPGTLILPNTTVGEECVIGGNVVLHPNVTVYRRVVIGDRSIIHSGARIGSDGFGYTPVEGRLEKIPQVGGCVIGRDVEIGANATIDRGSIGVTEIGNGVKIDNLVHIGHNVRIGDHSIVVAQTGISGSARVGSRTTLGGQVGVNGHITIGDNITIAAKSGVWGSVDEPGIYSGNPARPHRESLRREAGLHRIAELLRRVKDLEQRLEAEIGNQG